MSSFRYVSDREAGERHRATRSVASSAIPRSQPRPDITRVPVVHNVDTILQLGETRYCRFRRRAIGVPPLSYKKGRILFELYTRARALMKLLAETGEKEHEKEYYAKLEKIKRFLNKNSFPMGKFTRFLRTIGLGRNVFENATEFELLELADFFLRGRTQSSVQYSTEEIPAMQMETH